LLYRYLYISPIAKEKVEKSGNIPKTVEIGERKGVMSK
jgi:hypothetical protein